jgi:hypothetical protein
VWITLLGDNNQRRDAIIEGIDRIVYSVELGGAESGAENAGDKLSWMESQFAKAGAILALQSAAKAVNGG